MIDIKENKDDDREWFHSFCRWFNSLTPKEFNNLDQWCRSKDLNERTEAPTNIGFKAAWDLQQKKIDLLKEELRISELIVKARGREIRFLKDKLQAIKTVDGISDT